MPPEYCPNCGAEIPPKAKACPECGSDDKTGWSDRAQADRLGIPDDEFDHDEFVKEEFGEKKQPRIKPHGISWLWWVVGVVLLVVFLKFLMR